MNVTRRGVLRGFAGLAATALVPVSAFASRGQAPDLINILDYGALEDLPTVIEDQIFYLDGTIVLDDIHNLIIRRCTFIFSDLEPGQPMVKIGPNCENLCITNCIFEQSEGYLGWPVWVPPEAMPIGIQFDALIN